MNVYARSGRSWSRTAGAVTMLLMGGLGRSPSADPIGGSPVRGRGAGGSGNAGRQAAPFLYALGDSTGAGIGAQRGSYVDRLLARLSEARRTFRLENLSESGATTADVLRDQVPRIKDGMGDDLVVVGIGANDLTQGLEARQFGQRFEALAAGIRARTQAAVVVSNVPDVSLAAAVLPEWRPALAARVDAYNAVISRVSRERGLLVFDLCALTRQQLPHHPEYLSPDGYHPSDRGYQAWAEGLWQVVRRALKE